MRFIVGSKPVSVYASGGQDVNHLNEEYNGKKPDIIDNAYVIVNFENGSRSLLELCMFAENSDMQEELVATGNKGKIETSVPSNDSGKTSSNLRIGMRDGKTHIENVEVDKKIIQAGHHHGSTYYEHLAFLKAIENNSDPEVSLEDGLLAVAVGEAAEQSIKQGRLINIEEIIN
jgi:predicted dehydrogenase